MPPRKSASINNAKKKRKKTKTKQHDIQEKDINMKQQHLPDWAHERSKRALRHLSRLEQKSGLRQQQNPTTQKLANDKGSLIPSLAIQKINENYQNEDEKKDEDEDENGTDNDKNNNNDYNDYEDGCFALPKEGKWSTIPLKSTSDSAPDSSAKLLYIILSGRPTQLHFGYDSASLAAALSAQNRHIVGNVREESFMLTVFCDIFQSLEYLVQFFRILLDQRPKGRVLIIGPPQFTSSRYVPTIAFLSDCASQALLYLSQETKEWIPQPKTGSFAVPHILLGIGTGAQVAMYFTTNQLQERRLASFHGSFRLLLIINGLLDVTKSIKNQWRSFYRSLSKGTQLEQVEHLTSLLFSSNYLSQHSKDDILSKFYANRSSCFSTAAGRSWLKWMIHGLIKSTSINDSKDVKSKWAHFDLPLVALHSSENELIPPDQMQLLSEVPSLYSLEKLKDCLLWPIGDQVDILPAHEFHNPYHLVWLKGGHEILQERQQFVLEFLQSILQEMHQSLSDPENFHEQQHQFSSSLLKMISNKTNKSSSLRRRMAILPTAKIPQAKRYCTEIEKLMETQGIQGVQQALVEREVYTFGSDETLMKQLNTILIQEAFDREEQQRVEKALQIQLDHDELKKLQQKQAREAQLNLEKERKAQELKLQREQEETVVRKKIEQQEELDQEDAANQMMIREDQMSKEMARAETEQKKWQVHVENAKDTLDDLRKEREEEIEEREQFEDAQIRAEEFEKNRAEFQKSIASLEAEFNELLHDQESPSEKYSQWDLSLSIEERIRRAQQVHEDMLNICYRKRCAKKKLDEYEVLHYTYKIELEEQELNFRNAERAIKLAQEHNVIINVDAGGKIRKSKITPQQFDRLMQEKVNIEDVELVRLKGQLTLTQEQVKVLNHVVQQITIRKHDIEAALHDTLIGIEYLLQDGSESVHNAQQQQEIYVLRNRELSNTLSEKQIRAEKLFAEIKRIRPLKKEIVSSSVWNDGATQMFNKKTILKNLQAEYKSVKSKCEEIEAELNDYAHKIQEIKKVLEKSIDIAEMIVQEHRKLKDLEDQMSNNHYEADIEDTTISITNNTESPDAMKKSHGNDEKDESNKKEGHRKLSVKEILRKKDPNSLTNEEKQWIGIDLILHHEKFRHWSEHQFEQMKLDADFSAFHHTLTEDQVHHLLALPARIQLALPFISSGLELQAHSLIRKYWFEDGEEYFMQQDQEFDKHNEPKHDAPEKLCQQYTLAKSKYDIEVALIQKKHQRLRDSSLSDRSSDEQMWIELDRVVNPQYYSESSEPSSSTSSVFRYSREDVINLAIEEKTPESTHHQQMLSILQQYHLEKDHQIITLPRPSLATSAESNEDIVSAKKKAVIFKLDEVDEHIANPENLLIKCKKVKELIELRDLILYPRQSRSHDFPLPQNSSILNLSISIVFQGSFGTHGYKIGRIAAMLYFLPYLGPNTYDTPHAIGYVNYENVDLCSPSSLGKILIIHRPKNVPLCTKGKYQLIVGAPIQTKYSIVITCHEASNIQAFIAQSRDRATSLCQRLPKVHTEILSIFEGIRLAERKLRLVQKGCENTIMLAKQCEEKMIEVTMELEKDDIELLLEDHQRLNLTQQEQKLEKKFAQYSRLLGYRQEEKKDIQAGLGRLALEHTKLLAEKQSVETEIYYYQKYLPRAAGIVEGDKIGYTTADSIGGEYEPPKSRNQSKWTRLSAIRSKLPKLMTPAQKLRRKYFQFPSTLTKEERAWVILDRKLHYDQYPKEYDNTKPATVDNAVENRRLSAVVMSSKTFKFHLVSSEEKLAAYTVGDIERIMKIPWNSLNTREIRVRKILSQYRDEVAHSRQRRLQFIGQARKSAQVVRAKQSSQWTDEEKKFVMYDRVIHPEFYPTDITSKGPEQSWGKNTGTSVDSCPYSKAQLLKIIEVKEEQVSQLTEIELFIRSVMREYDPDAYLDANEKAKKAKMSSKFNIIRFSDTSSSAVAASQKVETDIDEKCRLVLREMDKVIVNSNDTMDSSILHGNLQRFPTPILRLELEKELDRLLWSQVHEREQVKLDQVEKEEMGNEDDSGDSDDDDGYEEEKTKKNTAIAGPVRRKKNKMSAIDQHQARKTAQESQSITHRQRRLREQKLGTGGCVACDTNPCEWKQYLNETIAHTRLEELQHELDRIKHLKSNFVTTTVALSVLRNPSTEPESQVKVSRSDLFDELSHEQRTWERHLRLNQVDHELHDAHVTKEEMFETKSLHNFAQVQVTEKVKVALEREHNRLVGQISAVEILEDLLESMLEGWVFGPRESERVALGYVPSIKRSGPLTLHDLRVMDKTQHDLVTGEATEARARVQQKAQMYGTVYEKWAPIEVQAQARARETKAVTKGSKVDHLLNETEQTLRFGLFCMTLMYFRGLSLLKTQKSTWSGAREAVVTVAATAVDREQQHMREEERRRNTRQQNIKDLRDIVQVVHDRQSVQKEHEMAKLREKLWENTRRTKREGQAVVLIQKHYRGHLGRKATARWKVRRAEFESEIALAQAAAITMQRIYRGRLGRILAEEKRIELAEFIAQIRAEEALDEEDEYWRTHRIERWKRKYRRFRTGQV